ncbi:MAG TPA: PAS domain S-box protein [Gemmatimonadales bacterium]|nr:PAS domain S-box protein [Gemmatimonadales bacterium]
MSRASTLPEPTPEQPADAYRALFEYNPLPMWVYDSETLAFLEVNAAAVKHYGYTREEFRRMSILDIRPEEDRPLLLRHVPRLADDLQVWAGPWRHRRKDGGLSLVRISSHPIRFAGREARLVVAEDVTESTRTAEALRESREQYRFFIERTAEGVWRAAVEPPLPVAAPEEEQVAHCTRHVRLVEINEAMLRMYACGTPEELLGTQLSATFDMADPRSLDFFRTFVRSGYRTVELESRELDRTGAEHLFVNNLLGVVEDGLLTAIWGTQRDVTERRAAEELVRSTRDQLEALVDTSPLPIVGLAPGGEVISWNRAAESIFGWTEEEAIGRRLPCIPDDRQGEFDRFRAEVMAGDGFTNRETVGARKDGTRFEVSISSAPLHDANRQPVGFVAVYVDVSGRVRAEEALRQSQEQLRQALKMEAVGRLAGGVAHDFNNLLSAILSYSEMVLDELPPDHVSREDVEQIRQAGSRAAELTHQLLAFSRRQLLQPRIIDLNAVVARVDRMLRRVIGEDIELRTALSPSLGHTRADAGQLEQVLMNLAVNARDAMPAGGILTITTANAEVGGGGVGHWPQLQPGGYVTLAVRDTGVGMSRDVQERIFEPFFTTKGPGHGTGLGLSTVYGIVAQSGGQVFVTSEPGAGSTFTIYLPAHHAEADLAREHAPRAPARGGPETVLLVEDEALVRQLTHEILRRNGYRVLEAGDGVEALAVLRDHRGHIDLLLTDVVMPRMSGHELVELARPLRPDMRILYVSGYSEEAIARQGQLTVGVELLSKPFTPGVLTSKIRELLDRTP